MAIFPHFLTYFITLFVVATTYMQLTSTERTQTLVTCVVGGTDLFCPSPGTFMALGGVQNMAIWGVKTGLLWGGLLWGEDPTRKPFYAPYHISLHKGRLQEHI